MHLAQNSLSQSVVRITSSKRKFLILTMKTAVALAYFVLLLGSAAAGKVYDSVQECEDSIYFNVYDESDERVEECLQKPGIAAVAEGFSGTDDEKKDEILLQCESQEAGMLSNGALKPERVKQVLTYYAEELASDQAAFLQTMANCDPLLQQKYKLVPYIRCLKEYCGKK